jgi:hypothetical protein
MHPTNCLVCLINPPTGRLEQWCAFGKSLSGLIYGDREDRWEDGTRIYTSSIQSIDEFGHARTINSMYILGEEYKEVDDGKKVSVDPTH